MCFTHSIFKASRLYTMDNSHLLVIAGFSLFFGFIFGFEVGSRYEIEIKVNYYPRPDPADSITPETQDDIKQINKVL